MILKTLQRRAKYLFVNEGEMLGVLCKNVIFMIDDPLGSQYLFEILHTSVIIKN